MKSEASTQNVMQSLEEDFINAIFIKKVSRKESLKTNGGC